MKKFFLLMLIMMSFISAKAQKDFYTQRQYISGHGCDDMVNWDFFCTGGNNSGKWTKIGVPSCWETQGFGTYQYGMRFYGKANPEGIANEKGIYKYEFSLPEAWKGRQIFLVFEASMTDTYVEINGRKAGSTHQGGFYRFSYDVSDRIFFGSHKNKLQVTVSKESENEGVNMAERRADYWNFGGIIRPVFIVSKPARNIDRVAINAQMDGHFMADCYLNRAFAGAKVKTTIKDASGKAVGSTLTDVRSDMANIDFKISNPKLWTAETPNLYTAEFTLMDESGKTIHIENEKFGFRTIEVREHDGVYVNGTKVMFKGANRHSFRPESGRTLSKAKNIEDVNLIKSMNMNAVRLSHYPADPEFYEACDSLGLYVLDELSGWHGHHETIVGQQLVKEMVTRDVNHPCIVFWDNGNEGGFNYELEPDFKKWDIQKRTVIYPWSNRNGLETKHYRSWGETLEYMREPEIFMPTEFLHGLYDGGHGAGLADYWEIMTNNPRCAGGFLWDLADEGVKRVDENGIIDCQGNFGADGIVGPHFEKEGSYYTIKQIWSPIQIREHEGGITVENHYDFLHLNTVTLKYDYLRMPKVGEDKETVLESGTMRLPDTKPKNHCVVNLPAYKGSYDAIRYTAIDKAGKEILTLCYRKDNDDNKLPEGKSHYKINKDDQELTVSGEGRTYHFSTQDGTLQNVDIDGRHISLNNGPRFIAARRADRSFDQFYNHDDKDAEKKKTQYTEYKDQGVFAGFRINGDTIIAKYKLGCLDSVCWQFLPNGTVAMNYSYNFSGVIDEMGVMFDYPEKEVMHKSWVGNGPYRVWQNRLQGPQYGFWENDYNDPVPGESFTYPEFKGYFANVKWMRLNTKEGKISLSLDKNSHDYVGIYQPRDGRDHILYDLPESGISLLRVIPAVRNKVNCTDLNGPSAQPVTTRCKEFTGKVVLKFE